MSYSSSSGLTSLIAQAKDDADRPWVRFGLACTLYQFLQQHRACLETWAGGAFDYATVVPSHHSRRGGWDHLKAMIRCVAGNTWPGYQWDLDLLTKTTESVADDRRQRIHPGLFTADSSVNLAGRRVLLVDDLYTSGSTSASAAHCLVSRGADPPIIVTIGRHLDTATREVKRFVDEQQLSDRAYEPDDCAVHQRPSLFSRVPWRPHPWTDWN